MTGILERVDAPAARRAAQAILHESRFHGSSVPRPLHSFLHDIGTALSAPARLIARLAADLGRVLPGGSLSGWIVLAAMLALAAGLVGRRYSRAALAGEPRVAGAGVAELSAAALERAAGQAEAQGRYADAVRLRFQGGLRRLVETGVVAGEQFTPTRDIARAVDSEAFDDLARQFDAIAYGGAPARAADAHRAREGWREIAGRSRRR